MLAIHDNNNNMMLLLLQQQQQQQQLLKKKKKKSSLYLCSEPYRWVPPPTTEEEDPTASCITACIQEIKAFVRGGTPGLARLAEVYPSILRHFKIHTDALYYRVMYDAGVPWDTCRHWRLPSDLLLLHHAAPSSSSSSSLS